MVGFMCVSMMRRARSSPRFCAASDQLRWPVTGGVAVAFADEQVGAVGDGDERVGPFGVAGIGQHLAVVDKRTAVDGAPD